MKKKLSLLMVAFLGLVGFVFAAAYQPTEETETIELTKANIEAADYLSVTTDNWQSNKTYGGVTGDFYNMSGSARQLSITVKGVSKFELFVQNSTAGRNYTVKVGDAAAQTITHNGGQVESSGEISTGTTGEVTITLGGDNGSVYPVKIVLTKAAAEPEPEPQPAAEPVYIDFTAQNYENAQEVASLTVGDVAVTLDKGTNNNTPKFYTSGNAVRLYGGNTMTVSSAKAIEKIVFTFASGEGTNEITANGGTFATDTWTGSANVVTFTIGGTSGHRRVQKLAVTLAASDEPGGEEPGGETVSDIWKVSAETPVTAAQTLIDNAALKVQTVYATTLGAEEITIAEQPFTNYIQVRTSGYPNADNLTGTEKSGSTSLIVTANKDVEVTLYYRHQSSNTYIENDVITAVKHEENDSKDLIVFDQADMATKMTGTVTFYGAELDEYKYATKKVSLTKDHVYTLAASGTTMRFYGIGYSYEEAAAPAGEGQVVWTAEEATPIVWDGEAVAIPAEKFAEAKVGDRLRVKLQDAQVYAQVDLRHGAYTLHKPIPCPSFDEVDYVLTGDILNIAKTLGVQFNGIGAKATEVLLVPAEEAAGSMGSIWLPTEAGEGVEMSVDIPAAHFANANNFQGVQVGDVIKIVANDLTTIYLDDLILNADGTAVVKTEENAAKLRENGLEINNASATITEVDLMTPGDIVLDAEPGDLTAAINAAADGLIVGNVTINLKSAGTYTVTEPIVAPANLAITGVEGAIIDASGLNGNLIAAPAGNLTEWQEFTFAVKNVTVKGLKKALFYSAAKNRAYTEFIIDNVVVEQAADATTIDFTKGGTAEVLTIQNSTFYAPAATTKSFYSSQGGQKTTEYNADAIQTFQLFNSTFVNLARTKNFWSHRQSNQKWMKYDVENNIFVDCGKSGQTIKGLNGGQGGPNPTWIIKRNTFNFTDDNGVLTDTSTAEVTGDEEEPVQESIEGVVEFKDAANGDFHLGEESAQNIAGIGDPRWFTEIQPADIVLTPEDITEGDITAAIAAKQGIHPVGNINITLAADVNYFVTESITADGSVRILGPENGQAVIDAANLNAPLIQMGNTALTEKKAVDGIIVMNVNIKGLKKALFYSAGKNYNIALLSLENDVIELAGDATTIDFTKGSCAMTVSIVKSTVYAPTATTKAFYSSQGGEKAEVYGATEENPQTFSFAQSTFYNLTPGKNFFTHRQNSQKWLKFDVKNNIFVNCGKSGQVIKGMNGGGASANPQFDVEGNAFNFEADGVMTDTGANEETGDADEPVKSFVAGVVSFTDAAAGNFGGSFELGEGATAPELLGDPRWTLEFKTATGISTVKTADQLQQNVIYNLNGQRVDGAKKGLYIVNGKKVVLK